MFAPDDYSNEHETSVAVVTDDTPRISVAGVRFKASGKIYFFDKKDFQLKEGMFVIVETARGPEFGEVAFGDKSVPETSLVLPLRPVIRLATPEDKKHHDENKLKEDEAFKICLEKIQKHELDMKLVEAQYTFDNSKLLFYFTSAGRVDFRELVKDLAGVFKTRIELRQIGIRDEAKLMGGLGACGRPLCCSTFLSDFVQVSIKMAKEQNLSLNSGKISGCCGRLMCCLQYEYSTYEEETAKTPPVDAVVKTADGIGVVTEVIPLAGNIKVRLNDQPDVAPKLYNRNDVKVLSRPEKKEEK
ncbi:MAG: stage 0 sporulation protein [Ruminococcaceae bacterium]|nr:stage 0 sporulation protein [Oscillospiraceae bacterium]